MGEQDRRPLSRRQAGSGQASQLTLEALFVMANKSQVSGPEPGRGDARGGQPKATEPRRFAKREMPPWPTVIATTVRLWLRRRGARLARPLRRRRVSALVALAVTCLAVGGLTVFLTRSVVTTAPAGHQTGRPGSVTGSTGQSAGPAGAAAAAWVARQVSRNAIVACDPSMCQMLQAHGLRAANLLVLRPRSSDPRFADVIVATQAVRNLFGSRLQLAYAPAVIASFGPGKARIDVRAIASAGAAAYGAALRSDWAARRSAAAELLHNPRVQAGGAARHDLLAGQVDSRLLITLAALAVSNSVHVVAFGGQAPGASVGIPMRQMDISGTGGAAQRSAELGRIRSFVLAQHPAFLPAHVGLVRLGSDGMALRIAFGAPSPLGLLLGRPVTQ
jgi:hypothetical protein